MKQLRNKLGQVAFWLAWPLLWVAFNNTERSRLLMFHDGKLLVIKSWLGDGKWDLPGGGKHAKESPLEALIREAHEELGFKLVADEAKLLFSEKLHDKGMTAKLDYFVVQVSSRPTIKPRWLEVSEFTWLSPDQLTANNAGLDILHGLANYHLGSTKPN